MKTISKAMATHISDFSAETELSFPAYALEKDHHFLDAIKIVSAMQPSVHFRLVFCGGTCALQLSKMKAGESLAH